jgi:4-diphosphocytidyl-2-C-methyl-D-erythritol kinase
VSATAASVEAQAKINLRLCVLARESNGYHQLESLFCRIDLADTVRVVTTAQARELHCPGLGLPPEQNLAYRAAVAFTEAANWPTGFRIEIEKRIPAGGGLGGGSADAGAVLRALNALAPKPLESRVLSKIALALGADVPFLTLDAPLALGWGRGERLLALQPLPRREVLLALPPFGVETKAAFGWFVEANANRQADTPAPLTLADLDRWDRIPALAVNDLEDVVIARHPEIGVCVQQFADAGARIARMSGSGSTVFGVFDRRVSSDPEVPAGTRVVHTRTCTSVAPVKLLD